MATRATAEPPAGWRVVGWYVVAAGIVVGLAAGVVALGRHASAASVGLACAAALSGAVFAGLYSRRLSKSPGGWEPGWRTWALIGASGPLLAGVSDHVMFVAVAFLGAMVGTSLVFEERRRRTERRLSSGS